MASAQVVEKSAAKTVLSSTPITQMIFFKQGMLLMGSNHFFFWKVSYKLENNPRKKRIFP